MTAVKHFAPKRDVKPAPNVPFSIGFVRDGVEETHEFVARPRLTYTDTVGLVKNQSDDKGRVLPYLDRLIRRCLVDDDGTPTKWRAEANDDGKVTAPDGTEIELADAEKHTAFEAGSSRRRWAYLMEQDDDVEVEFEQIMALFQFLTAEVAEGRPTSRSSRSSR